MASFELFFDNRWSGAEYIDNLISVGDLNNSSLAMKKSTEVQFQDSQQTPANCPHSESTQQESRLILTRPAAKL